MMHHLLRQSRLIIYVHIYNFSKSTSHYCLPSPSIYCDPISVWDLILSYFKGTPCNFYLGALHIRNKYPFQGGQKYLNIPRLILILMSSKLNERSFISKYRFFL